MINAGQMRTFVQQTLKELDTATGIPYSEEAVELLLMTAAHESHHGTYLRQIGGGPARGPYGMEGKTEADTWENWIKFRKPVSDYLKMYRRGSLEWDLKYATIMARIYYYRKPGSIPKDNVGRAEYAKKYWNTKYGEASAEKYLADYERYAID